MNTVQESHSVKELCNRFDNVGTIINEKWTDPVLFCNKLRFSLSIKYLMNENLSYNLAIKQDSLPKESQSKS